MTWLLLVSMSGQAHAYEFIGAPNWLGGTCGSSNEMSWPGTAASYLMFGDTSFFTASQKDKIEDGLDVWDAGPGTVNRGADFDYQVNGTRTDGQSPTNLDNGIWHITQTNGINIYGLGNNWVAWGPMVVDSTCSFTMAAAIVFNRTRPSWVEDNPSVGTISIEATTAHEAGHNMGLAHEHDVVSVMYRKQFSENGSKIRLGEDDYEALKYLHPLPSNPGKNFMLTKFDSGGTQVQRKWHENWTNAEDNSKWSPNVCASVPLANGPDEVSVSVNGTASSYSSVPMEWTLSVDLTCFDADDITIGTRTPTLVPNGSPYKAGPSGGAYLIPSGTPDGDYYVCAGINPDQTVSEAESSYADNIIRSEARWSIDCP